MSMGLLIARVRKLGDRIGPEVTRSFLVRSGNYIVNAAKRRAPVGRTGSLRRSIAAKFDETKSRVDVGTWGIPYGAAQEFGGVITPQNGAYLAIPTGIAYERKSPRQFDLTVSGVGGKKYLVDRASGKAAYRLITSVRLKPQPYLIPAFDDYLDRGAEALLNQVLDEMFSNL